MCYLLFLFNVPQLIPEGYLPVSMFPFPPSSENLRANIAMSRNHPAAEEIMVPNDCYWIGPGIGIPMANMSNPTSVNKNSLCH